MTIERPNLPALPSDVTELPLAGLDEETASPGISLPQVMCILRAYRRHTILIAVGLILMFATIIKLLPKSYVATATLIVNLSNNNPLASPDIPTGWQNTFIPTQIDLIQGPVVLQPVIDRLQLTRNPEFTRGFRGSPAELREAVLANLQGSLAVFQGTGSDLLYISATAKRPEEAATIANTVAAEYLKLNQQRTEQPASQRAQVYSQELSQLRAASIEAQNRVAAFRQKHSMVDLSPGTTDDAEAALTTLQQKLLAAQNQERDIQAQLRAQAPAADAAETGKNSLSAKLDEEKAQLVKLRTTLGPRHPAVLELQAQIAATQRAIQSGLAARLTEAQKLVMEYQSAVNAQRSLVLQRRRVQDEGAKLLLELQSAQTTYKRALDGYSKIQFASNDQVDNVSLVSRAAPPATSVKPNKVKYFLASCMLSLALAFGIPFAYELFLNRRLRCREDMERHFGIPVLAQFGPLSERSAR